MFVFIFLGFPLPVSSCNFLLFFLLALILQTFLFFHALVSCLPHHSFILSRFDIIQLFQVGRAEPKVSTLNSILYLYEQMNLY